MRAAELLIGFCLDYVLPALQIFLPYPYSKSQAVQWKLFERLFTDFRDCLTQVDYLDVLTRAKLNFDPVPPTWLGY